MNELEPRDIERNFSPANPGIEPDYDPAKPSVSKAGLMDEDFAEPAPTKPASDGQSREELADDEVERAWVKQTFGATPNEIRELVEESRASKAAAGFLADHAADYLPCPPNFEKLNGFLAANNLPCTRENLEAAFNATKAELQAPGRAATTRKPTSSGLSDASGPVLHEPTAQEIEAEAYAMPIEVLRETIQRRAYSQRGR